MLSISRLFKCCQMIFYQISNRLFTHLEPWRIIHSQLLVNIIIIIYWYPLTLSYLYQYYHILVPILSYSLLVPILSVILLLVSKLSFIYLKLSVPIFIISHWNPHYHIHISTNIISYWYLYDQLLVSILSAIGIHISSYW